MSGGIDTSEMVARVLQEAKFNASFALSVHQAMSPVINDLRVHIVELRNRIIYLEQQLTERGGK